VLVDGENVVRTIEAILHRNIELDRDINWKKFFENLRTAGYDVIATKLYTNPYLVRYSRSINNLNAMGIKVVLTNSIKHENGFKSLTDSVMLVEGTSILYERPFIGALVIISGDQDFVPLAEKARELGKEVLFVSVPDVTARPIKERFEVWNLLEFIVINEKFDGVFLVGASTNSGGVV